MLFIFPALEVELKVRNGLIKWIKSDYFQITVVKVYFMLFRSFLEIVQRHCMLGKRGNHFATLIVAFECFFNVLKVSLAYFFAVNPILV